MQVGFVGLRRMGSRMASNLVQAGHDVTVWTRDTVMPVTWTRRWDKGRVFYCSIGHELEDLKVPQVTEMIRRGALWAAAGKRARGEPLHAIEPWKSEADQSGSTIR